MARQYNPRFATPDVLESIAAPDLIRLLRRYRKGLAGISLDRPDRLNIPELSKRIMAGVGLPDGLVELVCMIDDLAKPGMHDRVVACAERAGIEVRIDDFGHGLVVKVMLAAAPALRDLLLEQKSLAKKSYGRYMAMTREIPRLTRATRMKMRALETALDHDFKKRRRQQGDGIVKGHMFKEPNGFRLIFRRGDIKRSVLTIDDDNGGNSKPLVYRPELYDVIRYDQRCGDLLINARSKPDTRAYCYLIGEHLFGDRFAFDPHLAPRRYSLNAIREDGPACVTCADIDGFESVRLVLLELRPPDFDSTPIRIGPGNVFAALQMFGGRIEPEAALIRAVFKILICGEQKERTLVIRPPITASFDLDDACELIEVFIERRGYLLPRSESLLGAPETLFSLY